MFLKRLLVVLFWGLVMSGLAAAGIYWWPNLSWARSSRPAAEIQAEIKTAEAELAAKKGELIELRKKLVAAEARLASLPLGDEREKVKKEIDDIKDKAEEAEDKIVELQERVLKLKDELENLGDEADEPATKGFVETEVNDLRDSVTDGFQRQAKVDAAQDKRIGKVEVRLSAVEGKVADLTDRVAAAERRIASTVTSEQIKTIVTEVIRDQGGFIDTVLTDLRDYPPRSLHEADQRQKVVDSLADLKASLDRLKESAASKIEVAALRKEVQSALASCKTQTVQAGAACTEYYTSPTYFFPRGGGNSRCRVFGR
jgi:chromosome segregation ATPase